MTNAAEYRGWDARGKGRTGAFHGSVAEFVERRYRSRWKSLRVTRSGEEVGGIGPHLDTGKRTWWGTA